MGRLVKTVYLAMRPDGSIERRSPSKARWKKPFTMTLRVRGKRVRAVLSRYFHESVVDTVEVMADPKMMAAIRQGERDIKAGRVIPFEQIKKDLGLGPSKKRRR